MAEIENRGRSGSEEIAHLRGQIAELELAVSTLTATNEKLEKERRFFDVILDTIEAMVIVINPLGGIEYANKAITSVTGYSSDEMKQMSLSNSSTLSHEEKALYAERIGRMVAGERPLSWENWATTKDGSQKMLSWSSTVTLDADKNLENIFSSGIDITKRIEAEKALKESEERYRELFANASDFIYTHDLEGRFTSINKTCTDALGYSQEDVLGKSVEMVVPSEYMEIMRENTIKKIKGEAVSTKYEIEIVGKAGQRFTVELNARLIYENGRPVGVQGIARDMTERKRAEEALTKAKEQAVEATRLKDKFVSLVSHDLRSPLSTMIGFLELAASQKGVSGEDRREFIENALRVGREMVEMIDRLLDLSMLQTGRISPQRNFLGARELVGAVIESASLLAWQKKIEVINDIPGETNLYVDGVLFAEVIRNLLSNSIKFTHEGGRIGFFVPHGRPATIAVRDTGVGIKPNLLQSLFKHEIKTSTPGTKGEKGIGIGLPLCAEIVSAHGGTLTVESEPGKGSVFYAGLPHVER
jgi:PAS domain S-box-containing protein